MTSSQFLDSPLMKTLATILLLLILPALPADASAAGSTTGAGTPVAEESISSNILTETASGTPRQVSNQPPGVSALDLSLFGIISLGVIGLFWIRRHTSEL